MFSSLTVAENLLVASHLTGHDAARGVAGDLLDRLDLRDASTELPSALPFGSLRLLEVGLALAGRPRLLLLDEPAAGLDTADLDRLAGLLDELRSEDDVSVLLVDHDLAFVGRVAQRVVVMDQGRVIADGTPRSVAGDKNVIEAFLGTAAPELRKSTRRRAAKRKPRRRREPARAAR